MKERILNLLAAGYKTSEIASIVGCAPGYVSQLLSDPSFKTEVEARMVAGQEEKTEEEFLGKRLEKLQHKLITAMEGAMDGAELPQLTRALEVASKVANEKKGRVISGGANNPLGTGAVINGNVHITQIALPAHVLKAIPTVSSNEKNEIIAINGKSLAPMSSDGVKNLFAQLSPAAKAKEIQDVVAEI